MSIALPLEQLSRRNSNDADGARLVVESLWAPYWATRTIEARNDLVLAYSEVVERVLRRLPASLRARWESEDLRGFGLIGLIDAVEHFATDSSLERFPAYAMLRIRGAIFDELRRADWLPRSVRQRVRSYAQATDELSLALGHTASHHEVCAEIGLDDAAGEALRQHAERANLLCVDFGARDEHGSSRDRSLSQLQVSAEEEPDFQLLEAEHRAELRDAIARLPERQRTVLALHLFGGKTQQQIGVLLGVSHSRVCQIESEAIAALRRHLCTGAPPSS